MRQTYGNEKERKRVQVMREFDGQARRERRQKIKTEEVAEDKSYEKVRRG